MSDTENLSRQLETASKVAEKYREPLKMLAQAETFERAHQDVSGREFPEDAKPGDKTNSHGFWYTVGDDGKWRSATPDEVRDATRKMYDHIKKHEGDEAASAWALGNMIDDGDTGTFEQHADTINPAPRDSRRNAVDKASAAISYLDQCEEIILPLIRTDAGRKAVSAKFERLHDLVARAIIGRGL